MNLMIAPREKLSLSMRAWHRNDQSLSHKTPAKSASRKPLAAKSLAEICATKLIWFVKFVKNHFARVPFPSTYVGSNRISLQDFAPYWDPSCDPIWVSSSFTEAYRRTYD